jgi:hypothetical protein
MIRGLVSTSNDKKNWLSVIPESVNSFLFSAKNWVQSLESTPILLPKKGANLNTNEAKILSTGTPASRTLRSIGRISKEFQIKKPTEYIDMFYYVLVLMGSISIPTILAMILRMLYCMYTLPIP